jgi:hypothetical protein
MMARIATVMARTATVMAVMRRLSDHRVNFK